MFLAGAGSGLTLTEFDQESKAFCCSRLSTEYLPEMVVTLALTSSGPPGPISLTTFSVLRVLSRPPPHLVLIQTKNNKQIRTMRNTRFGIRFVFLFNEFCNLDTGFKKKKFKKYESLHQRSLFIIKIYIYLQNYRCEYKLTYAQRKILPAIWHCQSGKKEND